MGTQNGKLVRLVSKWISCSLRKHSPIYTMITILVPTAARAGRGSCQSGPNGKNYEVVVGLYSKLAGKVE